MRASQDKPQIAAHQTRQPNPETVVMTLRAHAQKCLAMLGVIGVVAALGVAAAGAQDAEPAAAKPPVSRSAKGEIVYRSTETGETIGGETWDMTVRADGSRTVQTSSHFDNVGIAQTVVLRVDADFHPREVFAQYWNKGVFRNAVFIAVRGPLLDIMSRFEQATTHSVVDMPKRFLGDLPQGFAFLAHPMATDAWSVAPYNKDAGGSQDSMVFDLDNSADNPQQIGTTHTQTLVYVGPEPIGVPAGMFLCDHFRVNDTIDLYVTGPDGIFVKAAWPAQKVEYVLTKLERDAAP